MEIATMRVTTLERLAQKNARTDDPSGFRLKPKCYIAGPMRGYEDFNYPAFEKAERLLLNAGWSVKSPHRNPTTPNRDGSAKALKEYMKTDLAWVCESDALFVLDGWTDSEGATLEFNVAIALDITVYDLESGLEISGVEVSLLTGEVIRPVFENPFADFNANVKKSAQEALTELGFDDIQAKGVSLLDSVLDDPFLDSISLDEMDKVAIDREIRSRLSGMFGPPSDNEGGYPVSLRHPGSQHFHEILKELGDLHDRKQKDYGSDTDPFANVRSGESFGTPAWIGCMIRANDKMKRLQSFALKGELANEGAIDSFNDLAVYAIIGRLLFEETLSPEMEV